MEQMVSSFRSRIVNNLLHIIRKMCDDYTKHLNSEVENQLTKKVSKSILSQCRALIGCIHGFGFLILSTN